jgi:hypothetical protein
MNKMPKRVRDQDVEEEQIDLQSADRMAEEDEEMPVLPSESEKTAISNFCRISLQTREREKACREAVKPQKAAIKSVRQQLQELMQRERHECLVLPREFLRKAEAECASKSLPPQPPYIRLVTQNKDRTLTPEAVDEALKSLTEEDVQEAAANEKDLVKAIVTAVVAHLKREVRHVTHKVDLVESVPRGVRAVDVNEASPQACDLAIRLHAESSVVALAEKTKRATLGELKAQMSTAEPNIKTYFERASVQTQRVVLEDKPYHLCMRTTVSKPRVTFKVLNEVLETGLKEALPKKALSGGSVDLKSVLEQRKNEIRQAVLTKLSSLPTTAKSKVFLQGITEAKKGSK